MLVFVLAVQESKNTPTECLVKFVSHAPKALRTDVKRAFECVVSKNKRSRRQSGTPREFALHKFVRCFVVVRNLSKNQSLFASFPHVFDFAKTPAHLLAEDASNCFGQTEECRR